MTSNPFTGTSPGVSPRLEGVGQRTDRRSTDGLCCMYRQRSESDHAAPGCNAPRRQDCLDPSTTIPFLPVRRSCSASAARVRGSRLGMREIPT